MASPNEEMSLHMDDVDTSGIDWIDGDIDEMGWVLDRKAWDVYQLDKAEESGTDVRTKNTVKSIDQNGNVALTVHDREENVEYQIEADYAGLANGPSWDLAQQAGFNAEKVIPPKEEQHMGVQHHMRDPDYMDNYGWDTIYLEFNRDYAPEGYVWSFPEGKEYTRWGNGVPLSRDENASDCMEQYLKDHNKFQYAEDDTREQTMAIIPTATPLETAVSGKVALIGDTAHHTDALHGGGMMHGCRAAREFARSVNEV